MAAASRVRAKRQRAAGGAVEPVNGVDVRPERVADPKHRHVVVVPPPPMNQEPRRLVHDDDVIVHEQEVHRPGRLWR